MVVRLLVMIMIGALIGWITNKVAIKMLFRPVNPVKVLFFTIQGVFPKRKNEMAISLAEIIETEFLSSDVLFDKIVNQDALGTMKEDIMEMIVERIAKKIPQMLKMFLGNDVEGTIRKFMSSEGDDIFDDILEQVKENAFQNLDVRTIVKERIDELDFVEFEKIIFGLMNKELKHIEVIGFILGAIIGAFQFLVTTLL